MYGPTWKSSIATTRSPSAPRMTTLPSPPSRRRRGPRPRRPGRASRRSCRGCARPGRRSRSRRRGRAGSARASRLGLEQLDVAGERADPQLAALFADVGELLQVVDVDQVLGFASRSFIIGSRLCPPAMTRASGRAAAATRSRRRRWWRARTRMARASARCSLLSGGSARELLAGCRCRPAARTARARRCRSPATRQGLGTRLADLGIEQRAPRGCRPRRPERRARRVGHCDRGLAAEPGERERALRVDLADARRLDRRAVGEVPEPGCAGAGVEALDEADGVRAGPPSSRAGPRAGRRRRRVGVDVVDDVVHRRALLDDLADAGDDLVQARRDLPQLTIVETR